MKQKLTSFFAALLMTSTTLLANNITYTATQALYFEQSPCDKPITSQSFTDGSGTITFDGDITIIKKSAFDGYYNMTSITLPNTVTEIENMAFINCFNLTSIIIPSSVTKIGHYAFRGCKGLRSITFEGSACQNALAYNIFINICSSENPVTLILPEDWDYDAAPTDNATDWHEGYFNSNLYSTDGATDKNAAIAAISDILGAYSESAYLQDVLAEEVIKINNAANRSAVNNAKQAAAEKLQSVVTIYANGFSDGKTAEKAELLGEMAEPCKGCPAVKVAKDTKTVILYAPDQVSFEKVTEEE